MAPLPKVEGETIPTGRKLKDKVALITGGDSGIGRAVSVAFAAEGADVVVIYLSEHEDAKETARLVEAKKRRCLLISGDVSDHQFCFQTVGRTVSEFRRLDIVVNNAAKHFPKTKFEDITPKQLEETFRTNVFSYFFMMQAALPYLKPGATIINTASVVAYRGDPLIMDYSATKGAIVGLTRALSQSLIKRGIRVNGVAPGPVWTPLIPASYTPEEVATFGSDVPMGRPGQPSEVAPSYVFLASTDSSYFSGQFLHPNGGEVVNA